MSNQRSRLNAIRDKRRDTKVHLGLGIYADWNGEEIILTREDDNIVFDRIYLDRDVLNMFQAYLSSKERL